MTVSIGVYQGLRATFRRSGRPRKVPDKRNPAELPNGRRPSRSASRESPWRHVTSDLQLPQHAVLQTTPCPPRQSPLACLKASGVSLAGDTNRVAFAVGRHRQLDPLPAAILLVLLVRNELRIGILLSAGQQVAVHLVNHRRLRQAA